MIIFLLTVIVGGTHGTPTAAFHTSSACYDAGESLVEALKPFGEKTTNLDFACEEIFLSAQ